MWRPIVLSALLALPAACGRAATYYVSNTGNNSASGAATAPWATLQFAANQVVAGDTVVVRPGDYAPFQLTASGNAAARITFTAEAGARIVASAATLRDGINLEGVSFVTIDGFEITGATRAGVRTVGPYVGGEQSFAQHVTIRNVATHHNTMWGILTGFVHDVVIENNTAHNSAIEHGIYVSNSGDRPIVRGNTIYGNRANGIHMNADIESGLDGIISGAHIHSNVIHDNGLGGGSGINLDGVVDSLVENNLIYNAHASGISLYRINGALPSTGNVVRNNTVHQASDGRWALNVRDAAVDNTIANNIFLSDHSFRGAMSIDADSLPGTVSDYNVVILRFTTDDANTILSLSQWQSQTGLDAHSLIATASALFVNASAGDFRLMPGSPALDIGWNAQGAATDLRGTPRPQGTTVDIGAYESLVGRPGDFNRDGEVDAADYSMWRDHLGGPFDLNGNGSEQGASAGIVDLADYALWQSNFGKPTAAALRATNFAVPETVSTLWLLLGSIVGARFASSR